MFRNKIDFLLITVLISMTSVTGRRVCFDIPEGEKEDDYQFIDYDRITRVIEENIDQVMSEWRVEMSDRIRLTEINMREKFNENAAELEAKLTEMILANKTEPCPKPPTPRSELPDDLCEVRRDDACYWSFIQDSANVTFYQGEEICKSKNSKPAVIRDQSVYNDVTKSISSKIPSGLRYVNIWLGIKLNVMNGDVIYPDSNVYTDWNWDAPETGFEFKEYSHIYMFVAKSLHGMKNERPKILHNGVLCQI